MPARTDTRTQGQSWGSLRGAFRPRASVPPLWLATEILAGSGTQDCADVLIPKGSVRVWFERHHAKWSQARQQTITKPFEAVYRRACWYTTKSHLLFNRFLWPRPCAQHFEYHCEPQGDFVSHSHTPDRSALRSAARGAGAVRLACHRPGMQGNLASRLIGPLGE